MSIPSIDLEIFRGVDYIKKFRWSTLPIIYKPISGISRSAPCRITCVGHGVPKDYRIAVAGVKGMAAINSLDSPPAQSDYKIATVVDEDTIELNSVNSLDFGLYTSGGTIQYYTPVDMAGMSAQMQIRERISSTTTILELTTDNGGIVLDNVDKYIAVTITKEQISAISDKYGVYDLQIGTIESQTVLFGGAVKFRERVTRYA